MYEYQQPAALPFMVDNMIYIASDLPPSLCVKLASLCIDLRSLYVEYLS